MDRNNDWWQQYEQIANKLEAEASDNAPAALDLPAPLKGLLNVAADDIRTLASGLRQHEREEAERLSYSEAPRWKSLEEIKDSILPSRVEYPMGYYPGGIGPGSFDPELMYLHALACQGGMIHTIEMKSWSVLWLMDYVDWKKVMEHEENRKAMENDPA